MLSSLPRTIITGLLAAFVLLAGTAGANRAAESFVADNARLFSEKAVAEANKKIAAIKDRYQKGLVVETHEQVQGDAGKFASERFRKHGVKGVFLMISKKPGKIIARADARTDQKAFTVANQQELQDLVAKHFKAGDRDRGLLQGVDYVGSTLETNVGRATAGGSPPPSKSDGPPTPRSEPSSSGGFFGNVGTWLCVGFLALLLIWGVVGIFRAMSGAGRPLDRPPGSYPGPQGGYAGPQGGYQPASSGGGGGGGFFPSLLGGMFGAAAGHYIYDSFFRGGSSTPSVTPPAYGGGPPASAGPSPVTPDESQPVGGAGADWGEPAPAPDDGGADWSGGNDGAGADWSGGDDGGGADWGGGGGDGGGDWGGGGGGDGGADW